MKRSARNLSLVFTAFILLLTAGEVFPQSAPAFAPNRMDTILYGAAYYTEYMPYERLEQDVQLMQQAGINVVRVGESSWGLWEPADGRFEFEWMDRVVERMHKAGIKVIMGTPTYSIPAWLFRKHPEVTVRTLDGHTSSYGIRQNIDLANSTYRFYCERVIRKIVQHYKDHPAIIGYQIDNETRPAGAANHDVQVGFVDHLQEKFKSTRQAERGLGPQLLGPEVVRLVGGPTARRDYQSRLETGVGTLPAVAGN